MKSKSIGSLFLVLTLVAGILAITPSAFADHMKADVRNAIGSSTPGCETTNSCFEPYETIIDVGGEVTWHNEDTAAHTVTSGDIKGEGPDGIFDSSLLGPGKTFSHTFTEAGTFKYFCMVHPWMAGVVTVQAEMMGEEGTTEEEGEMMEEEETYLHGMSSDSTVEVVIEAAPATPVSGQPLSLEITFHDNEGTKIKHVNYAIVATQDGTQVLSKSDGHTHTGEDSLTTSALASAGSVDIQVTLKGQGLPDTDPSTWTGPKGDVINLTVVPEFGPIAGVILAISIVSIIALTAKTRVIPKL